MMIGVVVFIGPGVKSSSLERCPSWKTKTRGPGEKKIQVIKVVRAATGLGLKEAKALVDEAPNPVKEALSREDADALKAQLEEAGASVELR